MRTQNWQIFPILPILGPHSVYVIAAMLHIRYIYFLFVLYYNTQATTLELPRLMNWNKIFIVTHWKSRSKTFHWSKGALICKFLANLGHKNLNENSKTRIFRLSKTSGELWSTAGAVCEVQVDSSLEGRGAVPHLAKPAFVFVDFSASQ